MGNSASRKEGSEDARGFDPSLKRKSNKIKDLPSQLTRRASEDGNVNESNDLGLPTARAKNRPNSHPIAGRKVGQ